MSYKQQAGRLRIRMERLRTKYLRHRNFLMVLSVVVGVLSALAAVILKVTVHFMEHEASALNDRMGTNWLTAIFPLIGTGISLLLLKRVFKGKLTRGVGFIVDGVLTKGGRIGKQHLFGHIFTSAVTVAMGGSVGLEAPIVATGAAIGSNTGQDMRLSPKDTTLLLACGVASGIAAIFNSPIAGIIFALEVLLLEFSIPTLIPLLMSTATATVLSQVLYPQKFVFPHTEGWLLKALPFYVLLGLLCGLVSVYTSTVVEHVEGYFAKKQLGWKPWLMAGIPLCLIIFILPNLYGEGYGMISSLMHGDYSHMTAHSPLQYIGNHPLALILMCILLIGFKVVTASLTVSAGGNGGIFAPSLIIGGLLGFVFAYILNLTHWVELRTPNFIIAAMAGVLAGVMHAPLTAIFLLAEITGGYELFVPLMIVVALSYFITRRFSQHSIYHKSLADRSVLAIDDRGIADRF